MHKSLSPETNARLLAIWAVVVLAVVFIASPIPWLFLGLGTVFGAIAGTIQLRALRETAASLLTTQTLMEVRRVFRSSRSGRLYLHVFWACMVVLFVLAFALLHGRAYVGLLAGQAALAFTRELLTQRGTVELQTLSIQKGV